MRGESDRPRLPSARGGAPPLWCAAWAALLAAQGLGCAAVVGIEELSGTEADAFAERCMDGLNALRAEDHLAPFARWLDQEPCARAEAAEYARDSPGGGSREPDACGNNRTFVSVKGQQASADLLEYLLSTHRQFLIEPSWKRAACQEAQSDGTRAIYVLLQ